MMDSPTKTTTTKPVGSSRTDDTQAFRAAGDNGAARARETFEKVNAGTAEAATLMTDSYSAAVKGAQGYNAKFMEFAHANTDAAFEFAQKLSNVKSPSEFFELSTSRSRRQLETLTEQIKELTALAQKIMLATAEPFKTGANKNE